MPFKTLYVTLGNEAGETTQLKYLIRNTKSAQLWANCIQQAAGAGLNEVDRFYNFPGHERGQLENLINRLVSTIHLLKEMHPELDFPPLNLTDLQNSINDLHFNFAHSHRVTQKITDENRKPWSDFNVLLHAIEAAIVNKKNIDYVGIPLSRIVFTWNQPNHVEIPDECFDDFYVSYEFGTAYANYAHVGRHFYEMFRAQDISLADEHIVPQSLISADTKLWFGPSTGHRFENDILNALAQWFEKHKARFNRLGFFWGSSKLALGHIPVATLSEPLFSAKEVNQFIKKIAAYTQVLEVRVNQE